MSFVISDLAMEPWQNSLIFKGIALFCVRMSLGLMATVLGPTLTDMTYHFKTNYEAISTALALRGFGIIPGSLFAGNIIMKYPSLSKVFLSVAHLTCCVFFTISPYVVYLQLFWAVWTIIGMLLGFSFVACISIVLDLWQTNSNTHIQIQALGFTMGCILAPILANPFLLNKGEFPTPVQITSLTKSTSRHNTTPWNDGSYTMVFHETSVHYTFLLIGAVSIVAFVPWGILSLKEARFKIKISDVKGQETGPLTDNVMIRSETTPESNQTEKHRTRTSETVFKMLCILFSFFNYCLYFMFSSFIRTFSADHFDLDRDTASFIYVAFMAGSALSTVVAFLVSKVFSDRTSFFIFAVFQFLSIFVWACFSRSSFTIHWITSKMFPIAIFAVMTTIITFAKEYVQTSDRFISAFIVTRGVADLFFVWLTGHLYDEYGPDVLYTLSLPLTIACLLFAISLVVTSVSVAVGEPQYKMLPTS